MVPPDVVAAADPQPGPYRQCGQLALRAQPRAEQAGQPQVLERGIEVVPADGTSSGATD
ncbi:MULTISPECIES: hypothetical protein [unclassified Streptomyces]|uniref:hypothetical protein n=1 Tax=Streptomyces TaxID=1883 RepID=UPI0013E2BA98|nr:MULTISPECIES: hypothetical protein [unclassified Streptomyces]UQA38359.1 hypothetical protein KRR37_01810 [Streptomyces sp. HNA39]